MIIKPISNVVLENRVYRLCEGDIFSVNENTFEFVANKFYEVVEDAFDVFGQQKHKRTGKVLTAEQINDLIK